MDSGLPCPDLRRFRSSLWYRRHIRAGIMNSGFPGFDPCLPHPLPKGWSCSAAFSRPSTNAALSDGNSFPRLDSGRLPCGWIMGRERL